MSGPKGGCSISGLGGADVFSAGLIAVAAALAHDEA